MLSKSKHPELTMLAHAALDAIRRLEAEKAQQQSAANNETPAPDQRRDIA